MHVKSTYEVVPGDRLYAIAEKFDVSLADLVDLNQILHPDLIQPGDLLLIPGEDEELSLHLRDLHSAAVTGGLMAAGTVYDGIHPAPGTVSLNRAQYIHPPLTNGPGHRDPGIYSNLVNQFAVGHNPRYARTASATWCNIFLWDVSRAMGAEIPHWVDSHGDTAAPGGHAHEININGGVDWMRTKGVGNHGWNPCLPAEAQERANEGRFAVAMWKNTTGGHGHTAVVRPGILRESGPTTAQAGAVNFNMGHARDGFGSVSPVQYFWHD